MKRTLLWVAAIGMTLVLASGVALALNVKQCKTEQPCYGTNGKDLLKGTDGYNMMDAKDGGDTLKAFGSRDRLWAGKGNDAVFGGSGDDELNGDRGYDEIYGGGGDDEISAGGGVDTSEGGEGDDLINAGDGDEKSEGGAGNDIYSFSVADWGKDTVTDTATLDDVPHTGNTVSIWECYCIPVIPLTPVTIDLKSKTRSPEVKNAAGTSTVNWSGDIIQNASTLNSANDTIIGNDAANRIVSDIPWHATRYDQDTVSAGGGDDLIDVADIDGGGGGDVVDCGEGNDTVYYDTGDTVSTNCENQNP